MFPGHPSQPIWSHHRLFNHTDLTPNQENESTTRSILYLQSYDTFYLLIQTLSKHSPPLLAHSCFSGGSKQVVHSGSTMAKSQPQALFQVLLEGLMYDSFFHHVHISLPNLSLLRPLLRTSKHPHLLYSHSIIDSFSLFLSTDALH